MTRETQYALSADLDHVLAHTRELWGDLRGQRLFITGGTGFFGRWLLESLVRANEELDLNASAWVLTRNPAAFQDRCPKLTAQKCLHFHSGNVTSFEFPDGEFSHIIHAATENDSAGGPLDPTEHLDANVQGTRRVLEFAGRRGVRRLLLTSSGAIYGRQPPELTHVTEDYAGSPVPLDTATAYGQSKRVSEFLCAAFGEKHSATVTIARAFAFVGPFLRLDANFAIGNFIRDALAGGPIRVQGDGTPHRSYLYAADLAIWLWTILLRGSSGRAYNVGSDEAVPIGGLAHRVAEVVTPGAEVIIAQKPDASRPPARYVPAITRARKELGLDVWVRLRDAIERTAESHRRRGL